MKQLSVPVRYALSSALATGTNIAVQKGVAWFACGRLSLYVTMLCGAAAALVVKYFLDKRFIFCYRPPSRSDGAVRVILYLTISFFAAAVFWAVEVSVQALFSFAAARYAGAAIGLILGYSLKYELDKRFVFTPNRLFVSLPVAGAR